MNETLVTFQGWVGNEVVHRETPQGNVANLRVGSTPRIRKRSGEWVDGQTSWFSVTCWRGLADNVRDSIRKGDPVIVHGALTTHSWESENGSRSKPRIKAFAVGPNLNKGRALFTRDKSGRGAEPATAGAGEAQQPHDASEEGFPSSLEELQAGRDYDVDAETLDQMNADLSPEPAHA